MLVTWKGYIENRMQQTFSSNSVLITGLNMNANKTFIILWDRSQILLKCFKKKSRPEKVEAVETSLRKTQRRKFTILSVDSVI